VAVARRATVRDRHDKGTGAARVYFGNEFWMPKIDHIK
jgi:hypothetical protein